MATASRWTPLAEYQAYINQVGSASGGSSEGGVSGLSAGINAHQRCKFWQVGCWKRKIIDPRWPNNTVYFEFHREEVSEDHRQAIRGFINDWNNRVAVRWVEDPSRFVRVMFKVKNLSNACGNSIVGHSGLPQKIRIDPDCVTQRTVQHEMGHAIGLIHEQQRCDRDSYITGVGNDFNNRKECAASVSTGYGWSSMSSSSPSTLQWIRFQFPGERWVSRVDMYPRNDATYGSAVGDGFPVNFNIELSADGVNWRTVLTRTNYPRPTGVQTFEFTAQPARFVRVLATNLRSVGGGGYYFQIAEIEVF